MLFNSYIFVLFLAVTLVLYYLAPLRRHQIGLLIVASSFFYAFHDITLLVLLAISIGINAVSSYAVDYGAPDRRRLYATLGVVANVAILIFFKYSPMLSRSIFAPSDNLGDFLLTIPLPLGISFYTFQGISLLIDVFRERQRHTSPSGTEPMVAPSFGEHLRRTYLFISFFPQLVAGPIVKAQHFMPQIGLKRLADVDWEFCFRNLVVGYFLKMAVADNLKEFTYLIQYPYFLLYKPIDLFMLVLGFAFQLFADFGGYSSIALGLAGMFGYRLHINFNYPYFASSFHNFWKRWHISLSNFLMEYLYFPIVRILPGRWAPYFTLVIVMALGGLWHGTTWNFLVWGFVHGVFLSSERLVFKIMGWRLNRIRSIPYQALVLLLLVLSCLLFALDVNNAVLYLQMMFSRFTLSFDTHLVFHLIAYSLPVLLYHIHGTRREKVGVGPIGLRFQYGVFAVMLFLIMFNSGPPTSFIYFQF